MERKTVSVAAAAIFRDGKVLLCRRGRGELKGLWEFPGGKKEKGETAKEAAVREIREELRLDITPGRILCSVKYDYPAFHLDMDVVCAEAAQGEPVMTEHESVFWAGREDLERIDFCPADREIAGMLKALPDGEWRA